jgi:peptidoglycan/LPS O-acetylase OafA/YrhL
MRVKLETYATGAVICAAINSIFEKEAALSGSSKIIFANQLRGIAAIMVVLSHLGCVFWGAKETVSFYTGAPPAEGSQPFISSFINAQHWNFGALGVAIFFMISGFVIPMSLGTGGRLIFIVSRFIRIYPTYIIALCTGLFAVWLSCQYWGRPFMWELPTIMHNMLLIHTLTNAPSVDLVNWTLAIELKFYIVACLMGSLIVAGRVWPLLAFSALIFIINKLIKTPLGTELMFVSFMMLGVLFNYLFRKLITALEFFASASIIFAFFLLGWDATIWPDAFFQVAPNYVYGFVIFSMAYVFRANFRDLRVLDFFADISYPLYIVHSLIGYSAMRILFDNGYQLRVVAPVTALLIIGVAYALHVLVEKPTMLLGKRIRRSRQLAYA